ncbi:hypothetical protein [Anabaena subtropica]|uniref:Uncharacterized protein n=1 Tax=Anabaena subtropica FACHB-260 TaxID=2692884 RepID=A0ABR8CWX2_9NOST|nr:hypothetical protein [Anabaena subtropica]MBD2346737.1 hypothetical protein [Anabaena subtropica FACHB-260]
MTIEYIRLKNIKVQQNSILQEIFHLASHPNYDLTQIKALHQTLITKTAVIEKICAKQQANPVNLTHQSRKIYSWIKFLTDEYYLHLHLKNTCYLLETAKHILSMRGQQPLQLMIAITNLSGLYHGKISASAAHIMISEGFINAPHEVLQALVESALFGKNQNNTRIIRTFASTEEYSNILLELDLIAEVVAEKPQGKFYDLDNTNLI